MLKILQLRSGHGKQMKEELHCAALHHTALYFHLGKHVALHVALHVLTRWRMLRWFCHGSPGRFDHLSTGPLQDQTILVFVDFVVVMHVSNEKNPSPMVWHGLH